MSFYRVTTPQHSFTLPLDTSDCDVIQITYKQGDTVLVKEYDHGTLPAGMVLDEDTVIVNLTQAETKMFSVGSVSVQLRALTNGGKAYSSKEFVVGVKRVTNDEILV